MDGVSDNFLGECVNLVEGYRQLEKKCSRLESTSVLAEKFYNWAVPISVVADMHSVSPFIVRKYFELGLIERHPKSTDRKFFVRGSEALMLDFSEMKKKAKNIK